MTLILDSRAFIALERDERGMWTRMKATQLAGDVPITHGGVLGQVWRGGPHQARLVQALRGIDVVPLDERSGRAAGALLGDVGSTDVIDPAVVLLANDGDDIATSDQHDLSHLTVATGRHVELIRP